MKKSSYKLALLVAFAAIAAFSCRSVGVSSPVLEIREVRDDLGRTVKIPVKIERAISLAPSLTEMIFAAGAGDKLVGVTTYCNFPAETAAIEKVGDTQSPNIEKIIALRPQVIFISTASQLEAFSKTLEEQGIAVYITNPSGIDAILKNLGQLGELFGTSDSARQKIAELSERIKKVDEAVDRQDRSAREIGNERRRVFVQISQEPLFTIGKDSFLTGLVQQAGGVSTTKDIATAYPKISKETALAFNPDAILLSDSEDNAGPSEVFANSPAVKNGRVYRINADIISRPGPRLVDALEEIAKDLRSTN